MRITWLVPDDRGGGVISVAQACAREAVRAGHDATLLLALRPEGTHADEFGGLRLRSLESPPPHADVPARLTQWLAANPQDVLVINGCQEADVAIPYVAQGTRVVYAVHDTAATYFSAALRHEAELDGIIAVSRTVADRFATRLRDPSRLHVVLNGTVIPGDIVPAPSSQRRDDLVFLGGDKPIKGAYDCLSLWAALQRRGFTGTLQWFGEVHPPLLALIEAAPARSRIVLHGRRPRRAVFEAAAASKVMLMLSRVEPFGMATIECVGMGCLPVAWDIPTGTKEIVGNGQGFFAALGDFDALAACVLRACAEHAARFEAATAHVRTHFSEGAMWSRYERALAAILERPPAVRALAGTAPPAFEPPLRLFQRLPRGLRDRLRAFAGRHPRLGFALRDFRGR